MNCFLDTIKGTHTGRPPVWFMRQAGRYHKHYQQLRQQHNFMTLCTQPDLACQVTMGPIDEFGFDAAILFSDLLFPLDAMGMGLSYVPGPKLAWHLHTTDDLARLESGAHLVSKLGFQAEALEKIRASLPEEKGLIGFVGGPFTLFCYAVAGRHEGSLGPARQGLVDGRFSGFCDRLIELLASNMAQQGRAGADTVAILDTCAGELKPKTFIETVIPSIKLLIKRFRVQCPDVPISYYSKKTGPEHWKGLTDLDITVLGIDWHHDLAQTLTRWGKRFIIQGNIDPSWLLLEPNELERRLRNVFLKLKCLPGEVLHRWICNLGHGILPNTPETNVRLFLRLQREVFCE